MIDNQQVKYKIGILFFGLQIVCRSCFPFFVDWGGLVQKRQPGRADFGEVVRPAYHPLRISLILPITSRISSSPNIPHPSSQPYHLPSHLICYICDIIKT